MSADYTDEHRFRVKGFASRGLASHVTRHTSLLLRSPHNLAPHNSILGVGRSAFGVRFVLFAATSSSSLCLWPYHHALLDTRPYISPPAIARSFSPPHPARAP